MFLVFMAMPVVTMSADMHMETWEGVLADNLCIEAGTAADGADMVNSPLHRLIVPILSQAEDGRGDGFFTRVSERCRFCTPETPRSAPHGCS
jgi:hypothetical protein